MTPRLTTLLTALGAGSVTLAVSVFPSIPAAYRNPSLHVALETAASVIASLAAYLFLGRFRRDALLSELVLACALSLFAFANLAAAGRAALINPAGVDFTAWWSVVLRLVSAVVFAASAYLPERQLRDPRRAAAIAFGVTAMALAASAAPLAALATRLPLPIPPALAPTAGRPSLVGGPVVLGANLLGAALFAAAAVAFTARSERRRDELMQWLAAGATLAAFARLNYFLFPSIYSDWVFTGDFLRIGFYSVLLIGITREIRSYWRRLSEVAILEERRRIARDLHDGLAQDLAYISTQLSTVGTDATAATLARVRTAAERALDESRRAVAALTRPVDEPLDVALAEAVMDVAGRVGARAVFALDEGVDVPPATRDALIRISREAVSNAARHGRADTVWVALEGSPVRLRVADDGIGFDPASARPGGFGLSIMRERAAAVGATFLILERPGGGTQVEVALP